MRKFTQLTQHPLFWFAVLLGAMVAAGHDDWDAERAGAVPSSVPFHVAVTCPPIG